jgi:hypothetical protein
MAISPQVNDTERVTATSGEANANFLHVQGVTWLAQWTPMADNYGSLDWRCYYVFQVAPQLSPQGWVDVVPDPLLLRKSGSMRDRTWNLWI